MLIDRVLSALDAEDPERTGNAIRGSRLGRCARQSAYMLFPEAYPPAPLPARAKCIFKFGDMIHEWIRSEFRRVLPGEWGAEESRFHFRVPLTVKETEAAMALLASGALRGTIEDGVTLRTFNGPMGLRGYSMIISRGANHRRGLWLDLAEPALYVPLHVDGIADAGAYGLASVEIKSMASGSFTRSLKGHVDYAYRVQMATALEGTQLDTQIFITINKNTCHLLEVVYSRKVDTVSVTFTKQSRLVGALAESLDAETDWEAAQVAHPFEPALLDEARARVKRILMATPVNLPEREYGPSFICETCEGTPGTQTKRKDRDAPLKTPKPCPDCETHAPGVRAEARLPWQCSYCPNVVDCWPMAKLKFDESSKPFYLVQKDEVEALA